MRIGVISDTHSLLRPEALSALGGSDLIVHAGDIGDPAILEALETLAPVIAVRGNNDTGDWAHGLAAAEIVESESTLIYVLHDLADLDLDPAAASIGVVISGHSHKPSLSTRHGVLYLNPGSAGPRRFTLPISLAMLSIDSRGARAELIYLDRSVE